ncbi:MAG: rod shape-determining protein MreC [Betaproteobacteria bacterium]|nr:rod shape-determining protein MreC [Betaproteobacteria bacterium]
MEATPPPFFKRGPSPAFRLGVFAFLSVAIMVLDARFKYLEPARQTLSVVLYPLQQLVTAPVAIAGRVSDFFSNRVELAADNERLRTEALANAYRLDHAQALERENTELRALLQARERIEPASVMAEILYGARDPFSRKFVIDKGIEDKVNAGAAVIDNAGVIGQVTRAYPFLAEVTQITDKNQAVPVQNLRSGLRAIVFGNGREGTLDLRFMPVNADVQVGDTLVTSGMDGIYPSGLPVAKVIDIERNATMAFARITCEPLSGVDRRGYVLILNRVRELPERPAPTPKAPPERKKSRRGAS